MEQAVRPGSFFDTVKTVLFGALGVRRVHPSFRVLACITIARRCK